MMILSSETSMTRQRSECLWHTQWYLIIINFNYINLIWCLPHHILYMYICTKNINVIFLISRSMISSISYNTFVYTSILVLMLDNEGQDLLKSLIIKLHIFSSSQQWERERAGSREYRLWSLYVFTLYPKTLLLWTSAKGLKL